MTLVVALGTLMMSPLLARAVTITDVPTEQPSSSDSVLIAPLQSSLLTPLGQEPVASSTEAPKKKQTVQAAPLKVKAVNVSKNSVGQMVLDEFPDAPIMYWVALNESGFDPYAASGTGPVGVFQIAGQTWAGYHCSGSRTNASDNIRCARKIYNANGLKDWRWSKWEGFDGGWGKHL